MVNRPWKRNQKGVVSLSCCDALHSILETDVRWYVVGQGTLRAPDTRATPPSSRHDLSSPRPSLGLRVATDAAIQLHGSAPALVTVLASSCAVTRNGNTPTTTTVVSRTTSGPWRTRSCAVLSADYSDAASSCRARQNLWSSILSCPMLPAALSLWSVRALSSLKSMPITWISV